MVAVLLFRCARLTGILNHTWDEPANLAAAVGLYETGRIIFMVEHPPLERWVVGLPLYASGVRLPEWRGTDVIQKRGTSNDVGVKILFDSPIPYWSVLRRARLASVLVFVPLLFFFLYRLVAWFGGESAAALSVAFFAFDPTLLAQAPLATTDMAAAAVFMMAAYYGLRCIVVPKRSSVIKASIAFGIAVSAKLNVGFLLPGLALFAIVRYCLRPGKQKWQIGSLKPRITRVVGFAPLATAAAFLALWATGAFHLSPLGHQLVYNKPAWSRVPAFLRNLPLPISSVFWSAAYLIGMEKADTYLNGVFHPKGVWYYFIEAIFIKSAIAFGVALIISFGLFIWKQKYRLRGLALLLTPAALFAVASMGRLQIGIRHMLPVLPFLYAFVCLMMVRHRLTAFLVPLILVSVIETSTAWPDYIPYFNSAVGGIAAGDRYLDDSNLDMGQDFVRLADYVKTLPKETPFYAIFDLPGLPRLAEFLNAQPLPFAKKPDELGWHALLLPRHGVLAVGKLPGSVYFRWLPRSAIIKQIGGSIDVFDLDRPEVQEAARAHGRLAEEVESIATRPSH